MNSQRKIVITITYNEMGIIIDTKAEELDLSAQPEQPEWAKKVDEYSKSAPSYIVDPLAWALYQVWKEYDSKKVNRNERKEIYSY